MNPALFQIVSETVKAWPTFLPSLPEVRHIEPGTAKAADIRIGYMLAISWSLVVTFYVTSQEPKSNKPVALWAVCAVLMTGLYETALHLPAPEDGEE